MQTSESNLSDAGGRLFEFLLTRYRGIFATLVLLPVSVCYGAYLNTRNRIVFYLNSAPTKHKQKVEHVITQIQAWHQEGRKEKLCTARSGWKSMSELVPKYKLTHRAINIGMSDILELDTERGLVRVEPLVSMGQLSRSLISLGWTLAVMPELDDLTVGGLIMGFGVETSSHKYGLFQHICVSFEIVTAEGKLIKCSQHENSDLFYHIPWSHGTLGFLVAAELKIIPAAPFVKLCYLPIYDQEQLVKQFAEASNNLENDFVEALVYSHDTAVLMLGQFSNGESKPEPVNAIGRWYKPWFYKHVKTYLDKGVTGTELIPLRHYYHRHTRSLFWAMEEIIPFGNHPLFRILLGWALPPRIELLKYTETETTKKLREKYNLVQDMLVPMLHLKKSLAYFDNHFDIYPLWLSPMRIFANEQHKGLVHPLSLADGRIDDLYVDIGAYGIPRKPDYESKSALAELEKFVIDQHGYQALYAKTSLSREQFRIMFDHLGYDALRDSLLYSKEAFDEIYDKISSIGKVAAIDFKKLNNHLLK